MYLRLGSVPCGDAQTGWLQRGAARAGLHLTLAGLQAGDDDGSGFGPAGIDPMLNDVARAMPNRALSPRDVLITQTGSVAIVPDSVTRVRWELANPGQRAPVAVLAPVNGNVATAAPTPAPRSTALATEQTLVGATWVTLGRLLSLGDSDLPRGGAGLRPAARAGSVSGGRDCRR